MDSDYEANIEVSISAKATPEEEQRLIDAAVDKKVDDDLGKMLRDAGF